MFKIDKKTPIIIYGASYIGSVTGKELQKRGITIRCFIDQRAEEIKECIGVSVRKPEELQGLQWRDAVVFVAVKNVYYHEDIVQRLNEMGYEKILYKTRNAISGNMSEEEKILDVAYENMYKKGLLIEDKIPIILSEKIAEFPNVAMIKDDGDEAIVRMPIELVYTGKTDEQWTDVPVLAAVPYWQLFRYFEGIPGYTPNAYIDLCERGAENEGLKITDSWKEYIVSNRYTVYEQMRWRLEFEPQFFIENAPKVSYNSKGYFNLQTGKHRICFLVALGYGAVAVRVNKKDWESFFCNEEKQRLERYFKDNPTVNQPIIHPYFMGNINYSTREVRHKLMSILEEWYRREIVQGNNRTTEKIVIEIKEEPYYTEFFKKMGVKVEYQD